LNLNLTLTETFNATGKTYWATEVGKYRFVVEDASDTHPHEPFRGTVELTSGHAYGNGSAALEINYYKTLTSAQSGLKRRAAKYGI